MLTTEKINDGPLFVASVPLQKDVIFWQVFMQSLHLLNPQN